MLIAMHELALSTGGHTSPGLGSGRGRASGELNIFGILFRDEREDGRIGRDETLKETRYQTTWHLKPTQTYKGLLSLSN